MISDAVTMNLYGVALISHGEAVILSGKIIILQTEKLNSNGSDINFDFEITDFYKIRHFRLKI